MKGFYSSTFYIPIILEKHLGNFFYLVLSNLPTLFLLHLISFLSCLIPIDQSTKDNEIVEENQSVNFYSNVTVLIEEGNTSFDIDRLEKASFVKEENNRVFHSLQGETLWMKVVFMNQTNSLLPYFVTVHNAYLLDSQVIVKSRQGVNRGHIHNFKNQEIKNIFFNNPTWPIELLPGKNTIYLKIYDDAKRTRTLSYIKTPQEFNKWRIISFMFMAVMVFSLFTIIIVILVGATHIKQLYFSFYTLYLFGLIMDFLSYKGWGAAYLWREQLFLLDNIRSLFNVISCLGISFFFYFFYRTYNTPKWTVNVFYIVGWYFTFLLPFYVYKYFFGGIETLFLFVFSSIKLYAFIIILIHSYLALKRHIPIYLPFVFILHTLCVFIQVQTNFLILDHFFLDTFSSNMYYFTLIIEVVVLSYYILKKMWDVKTENKVLAEKLKNTKTKLETLTESAPKYLKLKSKALITISSLLYVKSDDKFLEFHTVNSKEIDRDSLKAICLRLPKYQFIQIHKSFIVNLMAVRAAYGNKVLLNTGEYLPVSRFYKKNLYKVFL